MASICSGVDVYVIFRSVATIPLSFPVLTVIAMDLGDLYLVAEGVAEREPRPVMNVWLLADLDIVLLQRRPDPFEIVHDEAEVLAADARVDALLGEHVQLVAVVA